MHITLQNKNQKNEQTQNWVSEQRFNVPLDTL